MTASDPLLGRDEIIQAFSLLGERLAERGVVADIYVIGGAAMALAYDARRATRDIDAIFEPHGIVIAEARRVSELLHLPSWWLNDQASAYIAEGGDGGAPTVFEHAGLRVSAASPEHLLAMKVQAGRRRDLSDIKYLVQLLGLRNPADILSVCDAVFPQDPVPPRAKLLLDEAFAQPASTSV